MYGGFCGKVSTLKSEKCVSTFVVCVGVSVCVSLSVGWVML